jgi:hypothetical protein
VGEAIAATTGLPDPFVRILPVGAEPVEHRREASPVVVGDQLAVTGERLALGDVDRVEQLPIDIELKLGGSPGARATFKTPSGAVS